MVYKQLVSLITRGHLRPGEKLPSERTMALELGVSRQSIREAIYRATTAGLMEVRQGEPFIISSFKGNLRQPLSILLEEQAGKRFLSSLKSANSSKDGVQKEPLGADGRSEKDAGNPEKNGEGEACRECLGKGGPRFPFFHCSSYHNVLAMHVMDGLKDSFHTYFRMKKYNTKPERKDVLLGQHRGILEAIRQKNPKKARKKIMEHLDYVEKMITEDIIGKR